MSNISSGYNIRSYKSDSADGGLIFSDPSLDEFGNWGYMDSTLPWEPPMAQSLITRGSIGAKFFESILFSTMTYDYVYGDVTRSDVKSDSADIVERFPYSECLALISDENQIKIEPETKGRSSKGHRAELFDKIGTLLIKGSPGIESQIGARIRTLAQGKTGNQGSTDFSPPPSPPESISRASSLESLPRSRSRCSSSSDGSSSDNAAAREEPGMGIYMTRLKERCDAEGWHWVDRYKQLGYHESWWRAEVLVQGRKFKAEAKSKKDARFQACKQACQYLGIVV